MWPILEAVATALGVVFAGWQIRSARKDANKRAVFEHLKEIDQRVQESWKCPVPKAQAELTDYYNGQRKDLSRGARCYLALLNSLDVLAFAVRKGLVDRQTTDEYLRTLITPHVISASFIRKVQDCCRDRRVYEHLSQYLVELQSDGRPRLPSSHRGLS